MADQAIQNLTQHSFESNDSVWHTDASRHSIEFSMIVGNDWTDGISFDVAYQADATLYLEMDNGETLPIKVGSSMIGEYDADIAVAAPAIEPSSMAEPEVVYTPPVGQNHNQNHLMSAPISAGLELNQDALFSSKPSYNPSEQSGLIVWNTEDVWHIEATGTPETSHYRGKIVSDQVIEDLSTFSFEGSDSLQYADDSQKVVEFSMIIANQWVDGISFKTPDNASVFLELEDSNNVPVQAGTYLQEINLV